MYTFKELLDIINIEVQNNNIKKTPIELYSPVNYILSLGGKRVRPVLVLAAYNLYKDNVQSIVKPALGIEVFHNFTLLHDDLMDNAEIRRGNKTVHKKWDNNTAILSGDAMMILAYDYFLNIESNNFRTIISHFNKTALEVCEGQQLDMNFEKRNNVSVEEYLEMIKLKTSVLLAAALKIGGLLADAPKVDTDNLYEFGKNIGLAFQLQDDYLDVYGDSKTFGKEIGGDITANKKTFLLISALNLATEDTKERLNYLIEKPNISEKDKILEVKEIYTKLGVDKMSIDKMQEYLNIALNHLNLVNVSDDKKIELKNLANKLMTREN